MTVTAAIGIVLGKSLLENIVRVIGFAPEIPSPKVRVKKWEDVNYTYDVTTHSGILTVKGLPPIYPISIQDTNSMDGLLDCKHIVLMTKDFKIEDLEVGDVIFYQKPGHSNLHQIVFIGEDKEGVFFICKGTNCAYPDPWAIRPTDIISLMRGIIY